MFTSRDAKGSLKSNKSREQISLRRKTSFYRSGYISDDFFFLHCAMTFRALRNIWRFSSTIITINDVYHTIFTRWWLQRLILMKSCTKSPKKVGKHIPIFRISCNTFSTFFCVLRDISSFFILHLDIIYDENRDKTENFIMLNFKLIMI